ncbi:MAG: efflux RND transporter periplasmic adaptor subunit [Saprospiraceae bacterium]|nr:efflux RND transporter periplasmic adaptor subunit [Saprospiraceae bacterium]MCF8251389.1 efflux RND transporter periplasmic adaptor subunit [Saprospiraceae bacterium]MCF8282644.1 efflux RND transporter periplasmic adaptor subunit [Bacteroidales bacterium]MCF8312663.1 efflux RND transporter periplasmic adaptor subunit [Saprospiraceae bacterium]MCF8441071.1 efflux RND transporter periplasmic adaptor subunit [Saprospiraceae bacterium]
MATNKKKKNLIIFSLVGLVLILTIAAVYKSSNRKTGETVEVEKTSLRTIMETVEASGKVFPKTEVKISSDVSGQIVELYVKEGDSVTIGQVLARVDPEAYNSQVERAAAGVNSAKSALANSKSQIEAAKAQKEQLASQLENAKQIHKRNEKLFKDAVVSQQDFDASLTTVKQLESNVRAAEANIRSAQMTAQSSEFQIKSAEASLREINTSLKRTTIYANMSGILSKLNVEKGERVVGTSMMAGTEIMRIADLKAMEVQVEVTENDLPRLALGQKVKIEIDAYLDRKFSGKVVEIAHTANNLVSSGTGSVNLTTDQVTNFIVTIDIDQDSYQDLAKPGKPYPFRPGMSASVEIFTNTVENVVSVPIQAVGTRDKEEKKGKQTKEKTVNEEEATAASSSNFDDLIEVVFVATKGDTVDMRTVKTGIQDNDYIQILSGLKEGEEVVIGPYAAVSRKLEQGSKYQVEEDDKDKKKKKSSEGKVSVEVD